MKKIFKNKHAFNLGFAVAVAILSLLGLLTYRASKHAEEYDNLVTHTNTVIQKLDSLLLNLRDAESSQRGLIITGQGQYSQAYETAVRNILMEISELRQLTIDNTSQQVHLDSIETRAGKKMEWMTEIIDLWLLKGSETAMEKIQSGVGWSLMDSIRSGVIKAQNEERGLLSERTQFKKVFSAD